MIKTNNYSKDIILLNFVILYLVLSTSQAFWFWKIPIIINGIISIFALLLLNKLIKKNNSNLGLNSLLCGFFYFFYCVWQNDVSVLGYLYLILQSLIVVSLVRISNSDKRMVLDFQTKALALLLFISFTAWIINLFYYFPSIGDICRNSGDDATSYMKNHIFFIVSSYHALDIRFHAFFLEPGHLGVISAFFIFANQYDYRKISIKILTIILLFTMSLAGYVLYFIGFIFVSSSSIATQKRLVKFLIFGCVVLLCFQIAQNFNEGDNYVNTLIIDRLQIEKAGIAGDNRTTHELEVLFERMCNDGSILTGISFETYQKLDDTSAGIKSLMVQKGIIGVFLLFFAYFFMSKDSPSRKWSWIVLIFYCISSYQRTYFTWFSYLIPYICSCYLPNVTKVSEESDQ